MQTILITTPSISNHDAVSTDVWKQQAYFISKGYASFVYAELATDDLNGRLIDYHEASFLVRQTDTVLIYHHSVYWFQGDHLLNDARCKIYFRYHNITPAHFFEDYGEKVATYATKQGMAQTERLIKSNKITGYIGASQFNCDELIAMGADSNLCSIVAPLHALEDFAHAQKDSEVIKALADERVHILFVGRVVPNKGHTHLLAVLDRYIDMFGSKVCLHLVGNVRVAPKRYLAKLKKQVATQRLGDFIKIWPNASLNVLHTLYVESDVFLVTSEHEGFCVPIIEAQSHKLPIVALDRTAIKETLGANQLSYDVLDYATLAAAVQLLATDTETRAFLTKAGEVNLKRFHINTLEQQLTKALALD